METDGFLVHGDAVQNCSWREAERLPYRQFDRACADFLCCTSPLLDKTNGFCYLSVYHQNIKITCRGGVSPPENERFILARSVYYLKNELARIAFPAGKGSWEGRGWFGETKTPITVQTLQARPSRRRSRRRCLGGGKRWRGGRGSDGNRQRRRAFFFRFR